MRKVVMMVLSFVVAVGLMPCKISFAAIISDGFYDLAETPHTWDGTDGDRTKASTADYDYSYGDEESLYYTLPASSPWPFVFYGQTFNKIKIDSNGDLWLLDTSNPAKSGKITVWDKDLSSNYSGGLFVQHKTNPERVVIEWLTETYTEEGSSLMNNFEAVIYQDGVIRFDYKSFDTADSGSFDTEISRDGYSNSSSYSNAGAVSGKSYIFSPVPEMAVLRVDGTTEIADIS